MLTFKQFLEEGVYNYAKKDIEDRLTSLGWTLDGGGGHDKWVHPESKVHISVPRHKGTLKVGTVADILKKSRLHNRDPQYRRSK